MLLNTRKEILVKFNPGLSANRPSNNWAQVYKWEPATFCWGVTLQWTSILSGRGVAILLGMLHVKETGITSGRLGLWLVCALAFMRFPFCLYSIQYLLS